MPHNVVFNEDGSATVTLATPVSVKELKGEVTYTRLDFARPKAKHLRAMDAAKGDIEKDMAVLAAQAGVSLKVIEELDVEDYGACQEVLKATMGKLRETGSTA